MGLKRKMCKERSKMIASLCISTVLSRLRRALGQWQQQLCGESHWVKDTALNLCNTYQQQPQDSERSILPKCHSWEDQGTRRGVTDCPLFRVSLLDSSPWQPQSLHPIQASSDLFICCPSAPVPVVAKLSTESSSQAAFFLHCFLFPLQFSPIPTSPKAITTSSVFLLESQVNYLPLS